MAESDTEPAEPILTADVDLPTMYRVREFVVGIIGTAADGQTNRMYVTALVAAEKIILGLEVYGQVGVRLLPPGSPRA
jgi:hypothetical protein